MRNYYVGIDVGFKGAISIIHDNNVVIHDMPEKECFNEIANVLIAIPNDECIVGLERQHAFPAQGVVGIFSLGWQYGYLCALLDYLKMPYIEINPPAWYKYYGLKGKKDKTAKKRLYATARKLYPNTELTGKLGAIKDGRVDSILIANYVKLKHM